MFQKKYEEKLKSQKDEIEKEREKIQKLDDTIEKIKKHTEERKEYMEKNVNAPEEHMVRRKTLINEISKLKGNIRVFCRIRPFSKKELNDKDKASQQCCITPIDEYTVDVDKKRASVIEGHASGSQTKNESKNDITTTYNYSFDKIFGMDSTQADIYKEVSYLIHSVLNGQNCCIFAYGQTGAGKTYTLIGGEVGESRGIIGRACEEIFEATAGLNQPINQQSSNSNDENSEATSGSPGSTTSKNTAGENKGIRYEIELGMLEIYCGNLRDLMAPKSANKQAAGQRVAQQNLTIQTDAKTREVNVIGANKRLVQNSDELRQAIADGLELRATASTAMNTESSRSHLIITFYVTAYRSGRLPRRSKFSLCDLAGSENIKKSNAIADKNRMQEATAINQALSALGNVIAALTASDNPKHVPYRDHKLTMLMSDSIGGTSQTLMFVNVSPSAYNTNETINSLEYATRARAVKSTQKVEKEDGRLYRLENLDENSISNDDHKIKIPGLC